MPDAHVKHSMPGRIRLQIPDRKHDPAYFARVGQKLTEMDGVQSVRTDSQTGSILINHERDLDAIRSFAEQHKLFSLIVTTATAVVLADKLTDRVGNLDQGLIHFTRGQVDLKSAVVLALAAGAAIQVLRKQVLPPAFTLVWTAIALIWPGNGGPPRH
jgi:hypothetical protein